LTSGITLTTLIENDFHLQHNDMILAKLKESTKEQHEALESVVDVMNSTFTLDDYKELITKFYLFYSAIEPSLPADELKEHGFDLESRRKLPSLERDLGALAILHTENGTKVETPIFDSVAKAFGAVYVLEGATLGGQVITRHLSSSIGVTSETGGSFFYSYGPNVGPMWKEFGATITAYSDANGQDDLIVQGAKETFDSFRRFFEQASEATV
jgi:heme oxygenase